MSWRERLGLLGRNQAYAALWGARTVSTLGNWVTLTALLLYLESIGASGLQIGIMLAARELPHLLGPVAGALADRVDQKRVMIGCDLTNSLLIGLILIWLPSFSILVALVAASSLTAALFMPSGKSAVPKLVDQSDLTSANALLGSSTNLSFAVGPVIGAALFAVVGVRGALLLDVLTFLISFSLLLRLPAFGGAATADGAVESLRTTRFVDEVRDGVTFVARHKVARAVAIGMFLGVLFAAIDNVALVFLIRDSLGGPEIALGTALGFYAVMMVLAPLILIRFELFRARPSLILLVGLLLTSAGMFLTGLSPVVAAAVAAYAIAGAGNGLENIGIDTLIGRSVPRDKLGRAFGVVYGPIAIAAGLAALIGGQIVDLTSPSTAFLVAGTGVGVVFLLVWKMLPRELQENR
ncbi:MAG: MFS transporter [Sphaerobacteraceae bacterium]|nr:MAG: MFS transporter [Sphaerobacteraceae bacterium]